MDVNEVLDWLKSERSASAVKAGGLQQAFNFDDAVIAITDLTAANAHLAEENEGLRSLIVQYIESDTKAEEDAAVHAMEAALNEWEQTNDAPK